MTSGIYKMTFDDGSVYIGQSVDIDARWSQHIKDMKAGKHTKKVQAAYDSYGLPDFTIIGYVHEDHLDIIEGMMIKAHEREPLLNSASVKYPNADDWRVLVTYQEKLLLSTADLIRLIATQESESMKLTKDLEKCGDAVFKLQGALDEVEGQDQYTKTRYKIVLSNMRKSINLLDRKLEETKTELTVKEAELNKLKSNWFVRWFLS